MLPPGTRAVIDSNSWTRLALFEWLKKEGGVAEDEMHRVFNCGIGMTIVVAAEHVARASQILSDEGEAVWTICRIETHDGHPDAIVA